MNDKGTLILPITRADKCRTPIWPNLALFDKNSKTQIVEINGLVIKDMDRITTDQKICHECGRRWNYLIKLELRKCVCPFCFVDNHSDEQAHDQ